jgi:hypothetical protein
MEKISSEKIDNLKGIAMILIILASGLIAIIYLGKIALELLQRLH